MFVKLTQSILPPSPTSRPRPSPFPFCFVPCLVSPCRKTIAVRILDHDEYERQARFYIELQEPHWKRRLTGVRVTEKSRRWAQASDLLLFFLTLLLTAIFPVLFLTLFCSLSYFLRCRKATYPLLWFLVFLLHLVNTRGSEQDLEQEQDLSRVSEVYFCPVKESPSYEAYRAIIAFWLINKGGMLTGNGCMLKKVLF